MNLEGDEKPLLATGELVESYRPLFIYIRVAQELHRYEAKDSILLKGNDLELVKELTKEHDLRLDEVISTLAEYLKSRVDPEIAVKSLSEYLGHKVNEEYAVLYYSKLIACWIVEAATALNIIKLKRV